MMDDINLEFEGLSFTDAELGALPDLEKAEMLVLRDTSVTDLGCRELRRACSLVEVSILSDIITDEAFQVLAQLPRLRSLQIHRGPKVGDKGLSYLSNCVSLRELYLIRTAITDRGLLAIHRLPIIGSLILDDTSISDDGCASLADLAALSHLSLRRTQVTGEGLSKLRDNEHFTLCLDNTPATDEGMVSVAQRLSKLQTISVIQTNVGNHTARALSRLTSLNAVDLSHTRITDEGLAFFSGHPFLDSINVKGCDVTIATIRALKQCSPRDLQVCGP